MNITELMNMLGGNIWIFVGAFLLVITVLVFVHEWGHYIVARLCGVHVESFSIGFGKELFGYNDKHGTRWKFSLIPLGGYVKLFGDTDPASAGTTDEVEGEEGQKRPMTPAELDQAFFAKPVWKRSLVVFAGPAINYIFAVMILSVLYMTSGNPLPPPTGAAIMGGSSAEKYGFQPHDLIVSIDGLQINSFNDIRREMMISLDQERHFVVERGVQVSKIKKIDGQRFENDNDLVQALLDRMGTTYVIEVERGSETDVLTVHPVNEFNKGMTDPDSAYYNVLFLSDRQSKELVKYPPLKAVGKAVESTYTITRDTLRALGQMVTGVRSATELGGIIRIAAIAGDMAQQGLIAFVLFAAILSVNLGFINLLPIPLLDGGHLLFYFFEAILGRPIPEPVQEYAFRAGLVFLVGIMAFANLNDIVQLLTKDS
jgi:regulator of sigma E protease